MLVLTLVTAGPAVRQGVAPGRGRPGHGGPDRAAPHPPPEPARRPHRAPAHRVSRAVVADGGRPTATRDAGKRLAGAVTVGGYRTGSLIARVLPGDRRQRARQPDRLRRQLRQPAAAGDDRAPPAPRQPDVVDGGGCAPRSRRRSTPTPATGSRASGCRRCRLARSPPASRSPASTTSPTALERGNGVILALPHLGGWEWAGRWLADRRPSA